MKELHRYKEDFLKHLDAMRGYSSHTLISYADAIDQMITEAEITDENDSLILNLMPLRLKIAPLKPKTPEFVELVDVREGMPYPLAVTFPESGADIAPDEVFEAAQSKLDLTGSREKQQLVFSKSFHNVKIEKIFSFDPSGYTIGMDVKVYNLTGTPITQIPQLNWYQYVDPQKIDDSYGHEGPIVSVGGSVELQEVKKLQGQSIQGPNVLWGAFESKYFIASFIPENPSLSF